MDQVKTLLYLADLLEMCQFKVFWQQIHAQVKTIQTHAQADSSLPTQSNFFLQADLVTSVEGFEDAIRKFVCHVICITYQVSGYNVQNQ